MLQHKGSRRLHLALDSFAGFDGSEDDGMVEARKKKNLEDGGGGFSLVRLASSVVGMTTGGRPGKCGSDLGLLLKPRVFNFLSPGTRLHNMSVQLRFGPYIRPRWRHAGMFLLLSPLVCVHFPKLTFFFREKSAFDLSAKPDNSTSQHLTPYILPP